MRSTLLRPGSLIRVEWRDHELVVHRPVSTVHFAYEGMELAGATAHLTALWVRNGDDSRRRKVLYLPTELVTADAVSRFQRASAQREDQFGAAQMPRTFQVPRGCRCRCASCTPTA